MGARSVTPARGSSDPAPASAAAPEDLTTAFGDGMDTMEAISEEMLNPVPGIDEDPDDETPWAANLAFPDLMDLARTIRRELVDSGHEDLKKNGWRGPIGLGGGNERTLLHNVRFWWWPVSPAPVLKYDRSLARWKKTVLLFHAGEMRILLRDAPINADVPTLRETQVGSADASRTLVICRPPVDAAGIIDGASTYKGSRKPEGQGKRALAREEARARGRYTGGGAFAGVTVSSSSEKPSVPKPGPMVAVKSRPQPKPVLAEAVEPVPPKDRVPKLELPRASSPDKEEGWTKVTYSKNFPNTCPREPRSINETPKPPSPRRKRKPEPTRRKRWASWTDSGSDDDEVPSLLGIKPQVDGDDDGLVISSEGPGTGFRSVCSLAVLSKPRKRSITKGINQLRDHDKALRRLLEVSNLGTTVGPKHIVIFTSEPKHFQDPMCHTIDVGVDAKGDWTP